jgi:hypothetical protein
MEFVHIRCFYAEYVHVRCFHATAAMVGERLVSVCGWEGGATMRSVPVTVSAPDGFF